MSDDQLRLFDEVRDNRFGGRSSFHARVFVSTGARDTSQRAADRLLPHSGTQRRAVYDFIVSRGEGGATDDEVAAALLMNPNSARPRRKELLDDGLIVDSTVRRKNGGGNDTTVWRAIS